MKVTSLDTIRSIAFQYHEDGVNWHFHCMTPDCMLNSYDQHAFVLESVDSGEVHVYFSDRSEKELAKELSPLLHGTDVMDSQATNKDYRPSVVIDSMKKRAELLNDQNISWHHHMLFPGCAFNEHSPQYVLMLEDSSTGEALVSITEHDPIDDLKQIESLYFVH